MFPYKHYQSSCLMEVESHQAVLKENIMATTFEQAEENHFDSEKTLVKQKSIAQEVNLEDICCSFCDETKNLNWWSEDRSIVCESCANKHDVYGQEVG